MADMEKVTRALAANLSEVLSTQVMPYMIAQPGSPSAHVYPSGINYDLAGSRGLDLWLFTCQVMIGMVDEVASQLTLYKYLSDDRSVKDHVESDPQLGGLVSDLRVTRCGGTQIMTVDGRGPYVVAEWSIEVYVPGSA